MRWRLYYDDGTTYEGSTSEEAYEVPSTGVLFVKHEDLHPSNRRGYTLRKGSYFLCWERIRRSDGTFSEHWRWAGKDDLFGLMDYYSYHPGAQKVLIGREIHDRTYKDLSKIADEDGCLCPNRPDCGHGV